MLKYDMGNAGDIIKHGLLVEFIEWWGKTNRDKINCGHTMKIADTFCGCPWGNMSDKIRDRLNEKHLKDTRLSIIQRKSPITDTYMGSSFLMRETAIENKMSVHIDVSDKNVRCYWGNATRKHSERNKQSIGLIYPRLDNDDGYNILDSEYREYAKKYDLILLDPYSDFLKDEFHSSFKRNHKPKYFSQILDLVKNNTNLFIAVFVLDLNSKNKIGESYAAFKESTLRDYTFSLRCPKIPLENTNIKGESGFDAEILLISQQIANRKCDELRKRLIDFAKKVTNALPLSNGEKVKFWPQLSFWGIDACKAGWFCIGLGANDEYGWFVGKDICDVEQRLPKTAKIALIDIPIGLSDDDTERLCDKKARKYVGARSSSVFRVPCRRAIAAYGNEKGGKENKIKAGKIASVEVTGGCLSEQTWGIAPKIEQMDSFLNCEDEPTKKQRRKLFREVHPEVCFRAFNDKDLQCSKKKQDGLNERLSILEKHCHMAKQVYANCCDKFKKKDVALDDIVDALAAALTAKIGYNKYKTLPAEPPKDSCGLPMEMVHICSSVTKTAS